MFDIGTMINMGIMIDEDIQVGLIKLTGCYRAEIFEPGMLMFSPELTLGLKLAAFPLILVQLFCVVILPYGLL